MSGYDTFQKEESLRNAGWTERPRFNNIVDWIPPDDLLDNAKGQALCLPDALELEELLSQ